MKNTFRFATHEKTRLFVNTSFAEWPSLSSGKKTLFITDNNVFSFYKNRFPLDSTLVLDPGEIHKNMQTIERIYHFLFEKKADRSTHLIGVGGGVITDLTGFAASTFYRGLSFGFFPTTLLASVDAALGGKNGFNLDHFKNSVGTIRQPDFVAVDLSFLSTLNEGEWNSAFAEIIKHGAIASPSYLKYLERHVCEALSRSPSVIKHIIEKSIRIKMAVVLKDKEENNLRKHLNFGHTFGHALEHLEGIRHGEAVARGMAVAARLSFQLGFMSENDMASFLSLIRMFRLPVDPLPPDISFKEALLKDKKKENDNLDLILLKRLGQSFIYSMPLDAIERTLRDLHSR
ncbi:MAG TPA: 3-dehydroquinate synthase [Firmicutes bacterium]|nr:3-dehydroquinate synthase [Bacillota bacterium]